LHRRTCSVLYSANAGNLHVQLTKLVDGATGQPQTGKLRFTGFDRAANYLGVIEPTLPLSASLRRLASLGRRLNEDKQPARLRLIAFGSLKLDLRSSYRLASTATPLYRFIAAATCIAGVISQLSRLGQRLNELFMFAQGCLALFTRKTEFGLYRLQLLGLRARCIEG
jgi:hypothetical protein